MEETIQLYEHRTQYYETDQMKIVHHSNYIRWMEEARIDFMSQISLDYARMEEMGIISPVLSVSCEYKSMVRFPETVCIDVKIEKYNGVKLELSYRIIDKETGVLRTTARSSHCFLDREGKPIFMKQQYPKMDMQFRNCLSENI